MKFIFNNFINKIIKLKKNNLSKKNKNRDFIKPKI